MRLLFFKEAFAWPRAKGHDVHCYYMMQALGRLGHEVSLVTLQTPPAAAVSGLDLKMYRCLAVNGADRGQMNGLAARPKRSCGRLTGLQERFRSYWGIDRQHIRAVAEAAEDVAADAAVVVGLTVLPYLAEVKNALRVWYAADEWAWHHLSQVRLSERATWENLRQALTKGMYERAYGSLLDRVWVVSEPDRQAMRWVAGARAVDVIPNGVDAGHYCPREQPEAEKSCVFWGRLDFGPNVQALTWFCQHVWPEVRQQVPDARFTIYGFNPTAAVQQLAKNSIEIIGDLPDLRGEIGKHQVVVLPFISGGGIKNKLLEAASMGKAIVCTPRACGGLRGGRRPPLTLASAAPEWVHALRILWHDADRRRLLGRRARAWVLENHSWLEAARDAIRGLERSAGRASA